MRVRPTLRALAALFLAISVTWATPAAAKPRKVIYTVIPGDTLWEIARRHDVSVDAIRAWNPKDLGKSKNIRPGMKLALRTEIPVREHRKGIYVIEKGDTLIKIAKKLKVTTKHLQLVNQLDPRRLRAGQRITYYALGAETDSQAIGTHNHGRLVDGEKLRPGPGYRIKDKDEVWGTNETITTIVNCVADFRRQYPSGPDLLIGDISRKKGGNFKPHRSHQTGLDVDIGYVLKGVPESTRRFVEATARNLDVERTWTYVRCLLGTRKVARIFMNTPLQKVFRDAAKKGRIDIRPYTLDKLFQVASKRPHVALIKHSRGHHDHLHVRFLCDEGDARCRDLAPAPLSVRAPDSSVGM